MIFLPEQRPVKKNLIEGQYAVVDTSLLSPDYFNITFFPEYIGGGISVIKFQGNPNNLKLDEELDVEVLDAEGQPVFWQTPTYVDRFGNYHIAISVYTTTTAPGIGTITVTGVASKDQQGVELDLTDKAVTGHNLMWTREILMLPTERNNSELIFDDPPYVSVSQVITPARVSLVENASTVFETASTTAFTIRTSEYSGFDRNRASNYTVDASGKLQIANTQKIVDDTIRQVAVNNEATPYTVNSIYTTNREINKDILGGYQVNLYNKYNTVISSSIDYFVASDIGALVQFATESYTLMPPIPPGYSPSNTNPYDNYTTIEFATQSLDDQLLRWKGRIVRVKDRRTAYLDAPISVNITNGQVGGYVNYIFNSIQNFTASLTYAASSTQFVTSSIISQSYIQFTIQELAPISGELYKIKAYYRRGSEVGDWQPLQEQIVRPTEFLSDARYPNQTKYAQDITDFYLLGYFTEQSVLDAHWEVYTETPTTFDAITTAQISSDGLGDSVYLQATSTNYEILTTKFFQNYAGQGTYTMEFNCLLQPNTELEIYYSSQLLNRTVFGKDPYPKAFGISKNKEYKRYQQKYSIFGKKIGSITNNSTTVKDYERVGFEFISDQDGLGRPLFRVKPITTQSAYLPVGAYIGQINVTPRKLNGFTPKTLQFAYPAKEDIAISLDETIDYKLEYYDYTGRQSEYVTYLENLSVGSTAEVPTTACQSERALFNFNPVKYYMCGLSWSYYDSIYPSRSGFDAVTYDNRFVTGGDSYADKVAFFGKLATSNSRANWNGTVQIWDLKNYTVETSSDSTTTAPTVVNVPEPIETTLAGMSDYMLFSGSFQSYVALGGGVYEMYPYTNSYRLWPDWDPNVNDVPEFASEVQTPIGRSVGGWTTQQGRRRDWTMKIANYLAIHNPNGETTPIATTVGATRRYTTAGCWNMQMPRLSIMNTQSADYHKRPANQITVDNEPELFVTSQDPYSRGGGTTYTNDHILTIKTRERFSTQNWNYIFDASQGTVTSSWRYFDGFILHYTNTASAADYGGYSANDLYDPTRITYAGFYDTYGPGASIGPTHRDAVYSVDKGVYFYGYDTSSQNYPASLYSASLEKAENAPLYDLFSPWPSYPSWSGFGGAVPYTTAFNMDGRSFLDEGCVGITSQSVSESYHLQRTATNNNELTTALKKRRLYWPTRGIAGSNYFTQNGGIYNLKFKLKRFDVKANSNIDFRMKPDSGSFLYVFIADVKSTVTQQKAGVPGWYPPDQNIVRIGNNAQFGGNDTPAITFYDSETGYYFEEYNINLVQYGAPAQLCFESSGTNIDGAPRYFGVLIDDIEFCKVGVTTDPYFIKP